MFEKEKVIKLVNDYSLSCNEHVELNLLNYRQMFSPQNQIFATSLLFGVLFCWGTWPTLRVMSKTEAPVFVMCYVGCQWVTVLIMSLSFGEITDNTDMFDESSFIQDLIYRPGQWDHIILVLLGGFLNANGDFLCAAACSNLPSSVASPIYGGLALIQGTILNCFVETYKGNLYLLFIGVLIAFLAIISMTASDYFADSDKTRMPSRSFDTRFSFLPGEFVCSVFLVP